MIVVDTSALMAILEDEPELDRFVTLIANDDDVVIAAPTYLEFMMVSISRRGGEHRATSDELLQRLSIRVIGWSQEMADIATETFIRFGKGRHPAQLNFGDCMAYALAKSFDAPLLFKGNDFSLTDIESAAV